MMCCDDMRHFKKKKGDGCLKATISMNLEKGGTDHREQNCSNGAQCS